MSRRYVLAAFCLFFSTLMIAKLGNSQSVQEWRATEDGSAVTNANKAGSYDGVTPGSGNTLPKIEELKGKQGRFVTWPGFMLLKEGGSRFFIQSTQELEYKIITKKNRIVIEISRTDIYLKNNRNPLVTTHFNTPVKRAYLKKRKKHVECIIELKTGATPALRQFVSPDGYNYLFIDFPPGNYPTSPDNPPGNGGEFESL